MEIKEKKVEETGLSLGSNIGDRLSNIILSAKKIAALPLKIIKTASIYETEPAGVPPEFNTLYFLNTVIIAESELTLMEIFAELQQIEREMNGTTKRTQNAPRVIDIDIIYYGANCINTPILTVPHPRWHLRRFVVEPLAEVRPDAVLPLQNKTVQEILSALPKTPQVLLYRRDWFQNI